MRLCVYTSISPRMPHTYASRSPQDANRHTTLDSVKAIIAAEGREDWEAKFNALESRVRAFEGTVKVEGVCKSDVYTALGTLLAPLLLPPLPPLLPAHTDVRRLQCE